MNGIYGSAASGLPDSSWAVNQNVARVGATRENYDCPGGEGRPEEHREGPLRPSRRPAHSEVMQLRERRL